MARFARIQGGEVREILLADTLPPFHPDIAAQFREVANEVREGWTLNGDLLEPPPAPNPAPGEAAALLAAGVLVVFAANPGLDGIYPMDAEAERRIGGILSGLANGLGLPKGANTVPYAELDGTVHLFSADEIKALAGAMRDFAFDIEQALGLKLAGQPADWPLQPIEIS